MQLNNARVVLLNGPAGCGKGYAVDYLKTKIKGLQVRSCKEHLHKLTQMFFNIPEDQYFYIYNNRKLKEKKLPHFTVTLEPDWRELLAGPHGIEVDITARQTGKVLLSCREAMIYVSEIVVKPRLGVEYFGKVRASGVKEGEIMIDDSSAAFMVNGNLQCDEVPPLLSRVGGGNVLLLRIHRNGLGFTGDSRRYIPDGVVKTTVDIYNNGAIEDYYWEVENTVRDFLKQTGHKAGEV